MCIHHPPLVESEELTTCFWAMICFCVYTTSGAHTHTHNSILCTFHCANPVVKTFLIQSFCLSLYGGILCKLNTSGMNRLEVALNKILRKIWHLPPRSHSSIVHIVAQVNTVKNLLYYRFLTFLKNTLSSPSPLVRSVFHDTCYFFNGYNSRYGHTHLKFYNDTLYNYAVDTFALSMAHALLLSHL